MLSTKLGNALAFVGAANLAQAVQLDPARLWSIAWSIAVTALGVGISYGSLRKRIEVLEENQRGLHQSLATKESVEALDEKLDIITGFLRERR